MAATGRNKNIKEKIGSLLSFCESFCYSRNTNFNEYYDNFGESSSHFANYIKELSSIFTLKELQEGFNLALRSPKVIPRLYVIFLIACATKDENQIKTFYSMISAASHPVSGFFLRFILINYLPKYCNFLTLEHLIETYRCMLFFFPKFTNIYPNNEKDAFLMIESAVQYSIHDSKIDQKSCVCSLYNESKASNNILIIKNFVEVLIKTINKGAITDYLDIISDFFTISKDQEYNKNLLLDVITDIDPLIAFNFVSKASFVDQFNLTLTHHFLQTGNLQVLKLCAEKWKTDEIHHFLLDKLGAVQYSEIAPIPENGSEMTIEFIEKVDRNVPPNQVRKMLSNELEKRNKILDHSLVAMVTNNDFDSNFFRIVFGEPFVFYSEELLKIIIFRFVKEKSSLEEIMNFIKRASSEIDCTTILYNIYDYYNSQIPVDKFIAKLLSYSHTRMIPLKVLLYHLRNKTISKESLNTLLEKCETKDEISSFCFIANENNQADIVCHGIEKILMLDEFCDRKDKQIKLYFFAINLIFELKVSDLLIKLTTEIVEKIKKIIKISSNVFFPLLTPSNISKFLRILKKSNNDKMKNLNVLQELEVILQQM